MADETISGQIATRNGRSSGSPDSTAAVTLWGAQDLDSDFQNLGPVPVAADGSFLLNRPIGYRFFKVTVNVGKAVFN